MESSRLSHERGPAHLLIAHASRIALLVTVAALASCGSGAGGGTFAAAPQASGKWSWQTGSSSDPVAVYGVLGQPAAANTPGGRELAVAWKDAAGDFWLFGGFGLDSTGSSVWLSDLWKFNSGQWTWIGGPEVGNNDGVYGTLGLPAPGNAPGGRESAVSWADGSGNFWLFGGNGFDSAGGLGTLNDLWRYSGGEWTWIAGSSTSGHVGVYGTLGVSDQNTTPGARQRAVSWADSSGNLWLFGGFGVDSAGTSGSLNDLWKYSGGQWTWVSGAQLVNQKGVYGTKGVATPDTVPGARYAASAWADGSGTLWLYGGFGYSAAGTTGLLNDLWKFSNGQWTWVSGSNATGQPGSYGVLGVAEPSSYPGARMSALAWVDTAGHFWLFGGQASPPGGTVMQFNDLWEYSDGQWTWQSGANSTNEVGGYGSKGTAASGNVPGARAGSVGWADSHGELWLFGGYVVLAQNTAGDLNDLWTFTP